MNMTITTKVNASPFVLPSMVNRVTKIVDFSTLMPAPENFKKEVKGTYFLVDNAVKEVIKNGGPLFQLASEPFFKAYEKLLSQLHSEIGPEHLTESFVLQFMDLLLNYCATGYTNKEDFALYNWGCRTNAKTLSVNYSKREIIFETEGNHPQLYLEHVSKSFPKERISVSYACPKIGEGCGTYTLLNGYRIQSDIALPPDLITEEEQKKWQLFSCQLLGINPDDYFQQNKNYR